MIAAPPKPRQNRTPVFIVIGIFVAIFCLCILPPALMVIGMMRPPQATEDSYAHGAQEKVATLTQLGLTGTIVSQDGNELFIDSANGHSRLYKAPGRVRIMKMSLPNAKGELGLVEYDQSNERFRFTILTVKTVKSISTKYQPGDVIWNHTVGNIALHPSKPVIAYFSGTGNHQFSDPQEYWTSGGIHEIDCQTGSTRQLCKEALDGTFCYDPTGKYLYYSSTLPKFATNLLSKSAHDEYESTDDPGHGIFLIDLDSLAPKVVAEGSNCETSSDGKTLIVSSSNVADRGSNWDTLHWHAMPTSPNYLWPEGWINEETVIATALPLTKAEVKFAPWTGSISGPHQLMRLVVMNLKTHQTCVIRTNLDRYDNFVYVPSSPQTTSAESNAHPAPTATLRNGHKNQKT